MPELDCEGNGHDFLCGSEPQFNDFKVVDEDGNEVDTVYPGDIVYLRAKIHGYNWPCSNFTLFFYGRNAEYLGCYEDRVGNGEDWWITWPYGIPNYPGEQITLGALETLTGVMKTKQIWILEPPVECEDITNPTLCVQAGCYWYNNSCHTQLVCEDILSQSDCEDMNCYWYNNSCHSTPPSCSPEGSTQCFGYDLYTCTGGQWVLTEPNSPSCGYVPPVCTEGDTKCIGYDLYTCINDEWILTEQNSSACGYTPPSEECEQLTTQAACEAAGCHWYPYPNPIGESSCHGKEMMMAYLPIIIAGVGGAILITALLLPSRKPAYPPAQYPYYYPPPAYPPPPAYHQYPPSPLKR